MNSNELITKSEWIWQETLAIHRDAPETRLASSLSSIDIFVALYYGGILIQDNSNPLSELRDRCIISKGHGSICMYPILADLGFFNAKELQKVCKKGGILGAIPDPIIPGYETMNGSLGHGLGVATGIAFALKNKGLKQSVFVVTGDGEMQEGANWEAIMFASHHKLDNLNLIIDNNNISMLGFTNDIINNGNIIDRISAFGWDCNEVDGHDIVNLRAKLKNMKVNNCSKPKVLLAHTIKGRGIPNFENEPLCHVMNPGKDLIDDLLKKL